jgi:RimJ/RimL family protein N-acetyltransferase
MNFDFEQDYILENETVFLEPLQASHFDFLLEYAINEPEIWTYSLVSGAGENNLQNYFGLALKARKEKREYPFAVYDKKSQKYVGSTRFYDMQLAFQTLQLGYTWYGKAAQGTSLNKNCKFLLLEFAFEKLNMARVEFRADNENKRSIAAMQSIGCVVEGVLRQNVPISGKKRRNSIVLSILQTEWYSHVKQDLLVKLGKKSN